MSATTDGPIGTIDYCGSIDFTPSSVQFVGAEKIYSHAPPGYVRYRCDFCKTEHLIGIPSSGVTVHTNCMQCGGTARKL